MILAEFSQRISHNIRGVDLAARYGGEEFVVIMPDTETDLAHTIADRLRQNVDEELFVVTGLDDPIHITVSIGVSSTAKSGYSSEKIFESADKALYEAKASGRNQVIIADA